MGRAAALRLLARPSSGIPLFSCHPDRLPLPSHNASGLNLARYSWIGGGRCAVAKISREGLEADLILDFSARATASTGTREGIWVGHSGVNL